ncbi:endonuclease/exonuclease/phosphatase family protein [Nocardioides sp.]|uniref:endonuclease/exonuclease/phosphatase family protein n=1 Tax=Nocardioides sp. TaxID=35761 RepID=UPI001A2675FF|nr:endonuclease/exonuclease/phosphatase family protein [Nocardioides sp.]MBJ7356215.1 endonuclease/exonuclease/phosphatase family protein [Nocardioides sp.]
MRLATFNILHGRNPADDLVDVDVYAAAIARLDADVLALQEVDRNQPRSHGADLTAVAAQAMGAVEHRFVAAMTGSPGATWVAATGAEQPDAATYGVALLSRHPVSAWQVVRLPVLRTAVPMRFRGELRPTLVRDEPRVAVAATVEAPGGTVTVACTHLSFVRWWNGRQLRSLTAALAATEGPLVLMGDLNMDLRRAVRISGLTPAARHPTFPADAPSEQLDHVLTSGDLAATASEAVRLPLSDHQALVAELR